MRPPAISILAPRFHEKRQIGAIIKLRGGINSSTMRIRLRKWKPIRATWLGLLNNQLWS
jgi:hypothetical protein